MQDSGNRLNIVLLDACRNDPFSRSSGGGLAKTAARGTFIVYATSPGDVASDGSGKYGAFTQQILKYIDAPGVSIERVFKRVKVGVIDSTNQSQRPWTNSDITGDFYFKLPNKLSKTTINVAKTKKKGSYDIKVSKSGYITKKGIINLQTNMNVEVSLEKIAKKVPLAQVAKSTEVYDISSALIYWSKPDKAKKEYNGYNDYHNTKVSKISSSNLSVSLWYKSGSPNKHQLLLGNDGDNRLQFASHQDGKWHHVAVAVDLKKNIASFYFDGIKSKTQIVKFLGGYLGELSNSIYLGANNRGNIASKSTGKTITNYFHGSIDNVRIYKRTLSSSEIKYIYNN